MIAVKNLQKNYGKLEILKGIDLEIHKGEVVVVIGPSGSGKSTFLRCLNLLEQPTGGEITFEGESITSKNMILMSHVRRWEWYFSSLTSFLIKQFCKILLSHPLR